MNCEEDENMKVSDRGQGGWEEEVTQGRGERTKEGKGKKERRCVREPGALLLQRITRSAEIPSFPTYLGATYYYH